MKKLHLATNNWYSKPFELKKLNILFTFQVNCPGCFAYGIPFMNGLYDEFGSNIGILGLSTAFESFDLNTLQNTKQFVNNNTLIGHTKEVFEKEGYLEYPNPIKFPVSFDSIASENFNYHTSAVFIASQNDIYLNSSQKEKIIIENNISNFLKKQPIILETFTLNQFKGTPTFTIFNENYDIIHSFFGHEKRQQIIDVLIDYKL